MQKSSQLTRTNQAGLSEYEGEVTDLGGKFIMPGILDTHVHVTMPVGFEYADMGMRLECNGKQEALDIMSDYIKKNPGEERYRFVLEKRFLHGDDIVKEDLDAICPDAEILIQEAEGHSIWVNSRILAKHGITDDTPDPVPGLTYYVRKDGHVTGNMIEASTEVPIILDSMMKLTDGQVDASLNRWIEFSVNAGVSCVFDAGLPGDPVFHEKIYKRLCELDEQGKLPVYIDGSYVAMSARDAEKALKELKRFRSEYNTEHVKVHTMKIMMDGTQRIHTAAMVTPYVDVNTLGSTAFSAEELADLLTMRRVWICTVTLSASVRPVLCWTVWSWQKKSWETASMCVSPALIWRFRTMRIWTGLQSLASSQTLHRGGMRETRRNRVPGLGRNAPQNSSAAKPSGTPALL